MLRAFFSDLSEQEKCRFGALAGVSEDTMHAKYLSPNPVRRSTPRRKRFEQILRAAEQVRPGELTREQLAAYFYAAPARTGTGQEAEAA